MNIEKLTGFVLAIGLAGAIHAQAQATDTTQQILQMHTFREGLVWIGSKEPGETENQQLLEILSHLDKPSWTTELEQFLKDQPQSPWAASLNYDYASFCRRTGRTTKALEHFEAAWNLTKNDASPQGQRLGGAVLANWMDLLSSLGRSERLKELIAEGDRWHFVNPRDRDTFEGAKYSYNLMRAHPEIAYRCGTFALKAVGSVTQPGNQRLESLVEVPSPTNGFSMAGLLDLAKQYGLNLVAVRRTGGQDLIVPSVVHWRQNHYAAILEKKGNLYRVSDPTFGDGKWLPAEVINEEASGEFLIPSTLQTNGWTQLAQTDAQTIRGMGLRNNIKDGKDKGCPPAGACPKCHGMPVWWVTEPYINLWLADEPISYLTSRGDPFTFEISYKQRDSRPSPNDGLAANVGWNNSWASYVVLEADMPYVAPTVANSSATLYLPNGGEVDFDPGQNYDSETRLLLQQESGSLEAGYDYGNNGLQVLHPDGSQDIYGWVVVTTVAGDYEEAQCFISRHIDPDGDTTWFEYDQPNFSQYLLTYVLDPDGRTNTLVYTANNLLSVVTNGYGQTAHFKYDSNGNLTNLVDAQGLSSSLTYDTNGYPTSLTTLYGTTTFNIYVNPNEESTNNADGNNGGDTSPYIDRAILVTDPVSAQYLYLYQYDCSSVMSATYSSSDVPTGTPLGTLDTGAGSSTNTLAGVGYRDSFFWGPRQYPNLSTTNMFSFTANDYLRGRMQHWLEDTNQLDLTEYVSAQQDPSPDGSTPGLLTFYDYQGKLPGCNFCAGTNGRPSVVAWRLPGGETHYDYKVFDYFGNVTSDITTYTMPNGNLGTRTNQFIYANNTYTATIGTWTGSSSIDTASVSYTLPDLLTQVIGADGNPIWSYGGYDTVTWTNFFNTGDQTNCVTVTSSRLLPDYATNGLGQVTTSRYSAGGNPVTYYDMYPGTGEFPNPFYGTLVAWSYPGYSKVTSFTSVAGLTTTNFYNTNGFLTRTIGLQIGRTNSFSYTTDGLIGSLTNELGLNVSATWDNLLRLTSVQYPDGSYVSNTFNKLDLSGQRDRLGNWTQYVYDGARHLIYITNANNSVNTLEWCGCGALTGIVDPYANTTAFNYDNQGNLTNVSYPDGSALNYQYNLAKWPVTVSDGAGRALQLAYNNQGLVTNVTGANGTLESVIYDILDRPASVTDANSVTVTNTFDALNELLARTWPDGLGDRFGYAASGLIARTNRDGKTTFYSRDTAGRLLAVTNANKEVVQFAYDPADDVTNLLDGNTNRTRWQYNQYGWLTNKTDALGRNAFRYAYNPNGWLTNRVTPEKGATAYTYDNVGNLKSILYPQSSVLYAYNLLNELTNMVDLSGTNNFTYTPVGQLASESNTWAGVAYSYVQGLRTALAISGGWTQTYGYDAGWRMTDLTSPAGTFAYAYEATVGSSVPAASSLISSIALPNGANIANNYDGLARLTGTALNNHWGHTLDGYTYTLDPVGLRTNILRNFGLTTNSVSVGYDNISQIMSWSAKETGGTLRQNEQLGFAYDPAHNLHSRTNGGLTFTFITDAANELTNSTRAGTFTTSGATPAPATNVTVNGQAAQIYSDFTFARTNLTLLNGNNTFTDVALNIYGLAVTNIVAANLPVVVVLGYDNNGNLTNDGTKTMMYDWENQLTNVFVTSNWQSSFVYDGLNRRRIERDYNWNGNTWVKTNEVHFIYDGYLLVQKRDTNNNVLVTYTRGLDMSGSLKGAGGIGGLLARTDANGSTFYHADGNGNITALMDGSENIAGRYLYNPYGKLVGIWGPMAGVNEMRFSSMPYYGNPDLYGFPGRFYDPNPTRWLNQDPIQEWDGLNLYRFVGNDSVNLIDPLGLFEDDGTGGIGNQDDPEGQAQGMQALSNYLSWLNNQLADILSHPGNGVAGDFEGPLVGAMNDEAPGLASTLRGSLNAATKKAAICGSKLHADRPGGLPDQLRSKYPETEFKFTPPGKPGQDVEVTGGMHPSAYGYGDWPPGVNFGDFKPNTPGGFNTFASDSQSKWNAPTTMLRYDPNTGNLIAE